MPGKHASNGPDAHMKLRRPEKVGRELWRLVGLRSGIHVRPCPFRWFDSISEAGFRSRLAGTWGIVDVQDCQDAPKLLAAAPHSLIDGARVAIRGGSAGGFTTLVAISIAPEPAYFKAACSLFGVSDLVALAKFTHKFELRYMDKLLGGTPQEVPEVYAARSPLNHADKIVTPLLVCVFITTSLMSVTRRAGASRGRRQDRASGAG